MVDLLGMDGQPMVAEKQAAQEQLQWCVQYRSGQQVEQYDAQGDCTGFGTLNPAGIESVMIARSHGGGQLVMIGLLQVPEGAEVEIFYRTEVDMGANGQKVNLRVMLAGWRMHDGSKREAWLSVHPAGVVCSVPDPQRPWPQDDVRQPLNSD